MPKRTPFYQKHVEYGGKIVDFAGFEMPISYAKGIMSETKRVRTTAGLFDVSHMGEIEVSGKDALAFVNKTVTNDASKLEEFQVQYTCMCYPTGGIVDDLLVYRLPDKYLLVVNAANTPKDDEWLKKSKAAFSGSVSVRNTSDEVAQLALQGPDSQKILQKLAGFDLGEIKYYWSKYGKVAGKDVLLSRTGYTGEDGFEIYSRTSDGVAIWDAIMNAGKECDIEPVALGARDLLRLEMGYCLYGNDMDEKTTPLEAGLGWVTKLAKEDFAGKEVMVKQKKDGLKRKLVAFELPGKAIARHGYPILCGRKVVGSVTSGNFSPSIEKSIGMGYVELGCDAQGTKVQVDMRGRLEDAVIVKTPFVKNTSVMK